MIASVAWPQFHGWARLQQAIAQLAVKRQGEALPFMKQRLSTLVEPGQPAFLSSFRPFFFGMVFAEQGEPEWAVELLARGVAQPRASGPLEIDPLVTRFREEMGSKRGAKPFAIGLLNPVIDMNALARHHWKAYYDSSDFDEKLREEVSSWH